MLVDQQLAPLEHETLPFVSAWHFAELEFCLLWAFFNSLSTWSSKQNSRNKYHPQRCLFQIQKKGKQNRCPLVQQRIDPPIIFMKE